MFSLDLEGTTTPKSYLIARWSHLPLAQNPVGNTGEKQIRCCLMHDVDVFSLDLDYYPQILSYILLVTPAARSNPRWQQVRIRCIVV